ncbi:HIRAN domain-containing protein [Agrilactobacillus yilanensis]|uniref:HIRAN domain-containing protein n=1 Tax=Agrilactobacillus yilanensis TaxID=2485997 RepID=A0ABW4J7K6_9LACO|nr:HIRAN domain-containing protein [Agrilactobacillus yilanensis]
MASSNKDFLDAVKQYKYEPSRHLMDFHIAGFAYYDGLDIIDKLTPGKPVTLAAEPDNPYDPEAVAIYYKDYKLGYVPKDRNSLLSTILYFGHQNLFETRIQTADTTNHPERQFRVVVKIKDNRRA